MGEYITMIVIQTAICPRCKKEFVPAPMHAYIHNGQRYCTYTCLLHRSDGKKNTNPKYRTKPILLYNKDGELIKEYPSLKEATKACGFGAKTLSNLLKENKPTRNGNYFKYKEKEQCEKD